jgi:hypothetical protein
MMENVMNIAQAQDVSVLRSSVALQSCGEEKESTNLLVANAQIKTRSGAVNRLRTLFLLNVLFGC